MKKFLAVVVIPILFFAVLELGLAVLGIAPQKPFYLTVEEDGRSYFEVNPDSPWGPLPFRPPRIAADKDSDVYRIFCLGASSVKGTPFGHHCGFPEWLRVRLEHVHPDRRFEVVRMGFDAKSARDIADLCEEVVGYDPDAIVVYTGHNEYLGPNLPRIQKPLLEGAHDLAMNLRLGRLLASGTPPSTGEPAWMRLPTREIADEPFLSQAEWQRGLDNLRAGLERIVEACEDADVDLILCQPACNIRDYSPRRSHLRSDLSIDERNEFREAFAEGEALLEAGEFEEALKAYRRAEAVDDSPALLHYAMAKCLDGSRRYQEAELLYLRARDLDGHPNRATEDHRRVFSEFQGRARVVDASKAFKREARDGLPGFDLFVDYVHPELDRQILMTDAILEGMALEGWIAPSDDWSFEDEPSGAEYGRRLGLDLEEVATRFSEYAFGNLLALIDKVEDLAHPLSASERLFRFALRYDEDNPRAHLGLAVVHLLREEMELAKDHLQQSKKADAKVLATFLQLTQAAPGRPRTHALGPGLKGLLRPPGQSD